MSAPDATEGLTLEQARAFLRANLEDGAVCPCCDQIAKEYKRSIGSSMVACLLEMIRKADSAPASCGWFHVQTEILPQLVQSGRIRATTGDYAKLRHWGLLEPHPGNPEARPEKSSAGLWRVTSLGRRWALHGLRVPRYAHVYDNEVQRMSGPAVTVRDCLTAFDFSEIIGPGLLARLADAEPGDQLILL